MDVVLASLLLIAFSPLLVLIALAIRLDSPGSAIFRQQRVGMLGQDFTMLKFRSMYSNSDEEVHRRFARTYVNGHTNVAAASVAGQTVYKVAADRRITPLGKWLRKTSLDELPQLLNVLRGEMSLVGPRPVVRYEVEEYTASQMQRLSVLPGMTGLPQISGRSGLTFDKIVRLDLEYIRRRSIALDFLILIKTIPAVLAARSTS
jgi:lipopolysaccharide/colanic/teichoic acid biosynthesis glycosyltransferase